MSIKSWKMHKQKKNCRAYFKDQSKYNLSLNKYSKENNYFADRIFLEEKTQVDIS